jgi:hypothetical protein
MGGEIGNLKGDVSRNEISLGLSMLSAVVVIVTGKPGLDFRPGQKNERKTRGQGLGIILALRFFYYKSVPFTAILEEQTERRNTC